MATLALLVILCLDWLGMNKQESVCQIAKLVGYLGFGFSWMELGGISAIYIPYCFPHSYLFAVEISKHDFFRHVFPSKKSARCQFFWRCVEFEIFRPFPADSTSFRVGILKARLFVLLLCTHLTN